MEPNRTLAEDWYPGTVPENVALDPTAYVESTYSFREFRSRSPVGLRIGTGASVYQGVMFDVGPAGEVELGEFALVNGGRIICDSRIEIGAHTLISWNVVLMDSYRLPTDPTDRRRELARVAGREDRTLPGVVPARPIRIGPNVWIGFDTCIMPGVTVGAGAVVGARSVVTEDVPAHMIAAGNPARVIKPVPREQAGSTGKAS